MAFSQRYHQDDSGGSPIRMRPRVTKGSPIPAARRPRRPWSGTLLALAACSSAPPPLAPQNSPPAPAAVRDGIGTDVDAQTVVSSLFANWDPFVDPEGSAVVYEWCIGTAPGSHDVSDWTSVGGATQAASSAATDLPPDRMLYVSVRARDVAGATSTVVSSDGVVLGVPDRPFAPNPIGVDAAPDVPGELPTNSNHQIAVERFGTTWTFAKPAICGRFVNGDWWVIGPVDIVAISPQCRDRAGRIRNGSMINPDPTSPRQGYDNAMFGEESAARYDAKANVARDIGPKRPLRLDPGSSLVSATSHLRANSMPQLETCAVLTCLAATPPLDAFRPPYAGRDKTCRWRAGDLDLSRLASLAAVRGAPQPADLARRFERPWLDHIMGWHGRYLHPRDNMPDYGRDIADLVGQAALVLQLDHDLEARQPLAIHMVQVGIDNYGVVAAGGRFLADGGSGAGRKFTIVLAGTLLQDDDLLRCARDHAMAFAEDAQTFFVAETSPEVINQGHGGYDEGDVGLAEWGQRHFDQPRLDSKSWAADTYRRCCTANAWNGFVLAARIMGVREAWGHDALFEYVDRYMQIEQAGTWTRSWSPFAERMWDRYRADF